MTENRLATSTKKIIGYSPLIFMLIYLGMTIVYHIAFALPTATYVWMVFKDTLDKVQGIGPVYWIVRRDPRIISVGIGTMHELSEPWRKGRGVYVALFRRSLQVGLCRRQQMDEVTGTLSAVGGRWLNTTPKEIGNWNAKKKTGTASA